MQIHDFPAIFPKENNVRNFQSNSLKEYLVGLILKEGISSPVTLDRLITATTFPPKIEFSVVDLLIYVHGKHLRSCRDGQLT